MDFTNNKKEKFYKMHAKNVLEKFNTSAKTGLNNREANIRLRKNGKNIISGKRKKGIFSMFFQQFKDFMILVLILAAVISFFMGEFTDTLVIFSIVILNAILGFVQEFKAEKSLEKLKRIAAPKANVLREGKIYTEKPEVLVPGDIILLSMGDRVPADMRIIEAKNLEVDQSILTGESNPVTKNSDILYAEDINPGDQKNILFMGSMINRGKAKAVVIRTGSETEMGRIASLIKNEEKALTPLQKRIKHLGYWLVMFSIIFTFAIVFIGILKGHSLYQMFLAGISLAVAAIPEGLPAVVTLVLALGVQKMIKRNAIVRRLPAVETLGCTTIICSDKTGTLTENKMKAEKVYYNNKLKDINDCKIDRELKKLLEIGAICNSSKIKDTNNNGPLEKIKNVITGKKQPALIGNPTDIALVKTIYNFNYNYEELKNDYKIIAEEEFTSRRKRMSVLVKKQNRQEEIWLKGAPEIILDKCEKILINGKIEKLNNEKKEEISEACDLMAGKALRVLGFAYKNLDRKIKSDQLLNNEKKLIFVGLIGLMDPPRKEAKEAVRKCHAAGIKPVMITGDHSLTAKVIAKKVGIISEYDKVVEGEKLKNISDKHFETLIKNRRVFARITPEDKLKIIKAFQKSGEVVAMTGDGINDAPALKKADIGIAMGKTGSDVAKEVASLILADDNFATIVAAVEEGRKIYNNIRKFIRYLLSCNIGELLTIFAGIALGLPLPLVPIQILWVNLVTDGLPALALGLENEEDDVMKKNPRNPSESIFAGGMTNKIISQGFCIGISTTLVFLYSLFRMNSTLEVARTMAFSVLVFSQLFFVFSCRSETKAFWSINPFGNIYLIFAVLISVFMQLIVIYHPLLASFFGTEPLNILQWIIILSMAIWPTILLEMINK